MRSDRRQERIQRLRRRILYERVVLLGAVVFLLVLYLAERERFCPIAVDGQVVLWARSSAQARAYLAEVRKQFAPHAADKVEFQQKVQLGPAGRFRGDRIPSLQEAVALLRSRLTALISAYAILVDGTPVAALPSEAKARDALEAVKTKFTPGDGQRVVGPAFKEDVTIVRRKVNARLYCDSPAEAEHRLAGEEEADVRYVVKRGDTVSSITAAHHITAARLLQLNPDIRGVKELTPGISVFVRQPKPLLTVRVEVRKSVRPQPGSPGAEGGPVQKTFIYENLKVVGQK